MDVSIYGVRGLAGNVRDRTSTEVIEGAGDDRRIRRIFRGGSWDNMEAICRSGQRTWLDPTVVSPLVGFRLVKTPKPRD